MVLKCSKTCKTCHIQVPPPSHCCSSLRDLTCLYLYFIASLLPHCISSCCCQASKYTIHTPVSSLDRKGVLMEISLVVSGPARERFFLDPVSFFHVSIPFPGNPGKPDSTFLFLTLHRITLIPRDYLSWIPSHESAKQIQHTW